MNKKWGVLVENEGAEIEFIRLFSSQEEAQVYKEELEADGYYYHVALLSPKRVESYEEEGLETFIRS